MKNKKYNYAFIDGNNLILGLRDQGWKLDYKKFRQYLKDKYRVEKAFWFVGYVSKNKLIYEDMKKAGFELVFKETVVDKYGNTKGNIDVLLAIDCFRKLDEFSEFILVSGDGDFADLITFMIEREKSFKIITPEERHFPKLFRPFEKECSYLSRYKLKEKLEYKKRHKN